MKRDRRLLSLTAILPLIFNAIHPAAAADRWEEAAGGAVAILPAPTQAKGITGGSLYCAEQKWAFLFRMQGAAVLGGLVKIGIEGQTLELAGIEAQGSLQVAVPTEILAALKAGSRMRVSVGSDEPAAQATFSLRNSARVIEAVAPRCSQVDMSAYEAVVLLDTGPAVDAARDLFADEIELFRRVTGKQPTVSATRIDRPDDKRLLFGALCGSASYYGTSGCTLAGWASSGTADDWQPVYATDGVRLYLDEARTRDGWPGLATLPMLNGTEAAHWTWAGDAYRAEGGEMLADDETIAQGDGTQ